MKDYYFILFMLAMLVVLSCSLVLMSFSYLVVNVFG